MNFNVFQDFGVGAMAHFQRLQELLQNALQKSNILRPNSLPVAVPRKLRETIMHIPACTQAS